eukprot:CAMPEP_0115373044 /NCGR_PEP_ID=MMETSP0271-20121206/1221_1 /TAXON_ID=71861 /ORGANISM="Scrippsiella trochoidea, Strain CCMP3099" /LENGTH=78 /DNA_ID=CAMNT_0002796019 /DNA_START=154 /DNA_END=391 /DNA_ORIENTATION=-
MRLGVEICAEDLRKALDGQWIAQNLLRGACKTPTALTLQSPEMAHKGGGAATTTACVAARMNNFVDLVDDQTPPNKAI